MTPFSEVLEAFRNGRMVLMLDDELRENEGDLVIATEKVTPEQVAFMMSEGRGLICLTLGTDAAERLNLQLQTASNSSLFQTPFAVSVDHRDVGADGVTARSRVHTMRRIIDRESHSDEFISPGHVFPLIASPAGVLGRRGQTEGSYDLARIAGFSPSAVICEVLAADGSMARGEELSRFARLHDLPVTSVAEVMQYRINNEILVRNVSEDLVELGGSNFRLMVFADDVERKEHLALITEGTSSAVSAQQAPLVRIHSECLTGDVLGSRRCDCGLQLARSMELIRKEGSGIILYLRQEGRGIGLANKVRSYALQELGADTVDANLKLGFQADQRDFVVAAKILKALGIRRIRLLTNNPRKIEALESAGIDVQERIALVFAPDEHMQSYLDTKREKLGHLI